LVFLEVIKVPWIKVSSDLHKGMKEYLVDIEGMSLGDLVEAAIAFAIENLDDFEEFAEIGETEEDTEEEEEESEDEEEEED
jgi:TATA-binding protein-associated factor Taf7